MAKTENGETKTRKAPVRRPKTLYVFATVEGGAAKIVGVTFNAEQGMEILDQHPGASRLRVTVNPDGTAVLPE